MIENQHEETSQTMESQNCGAYNGDGAPECRKCGQPFDEVRRRNTRWRNIIFRVILYSLLTVVILVTIPCFLEAPKRPYVAPLRGDMRTLTIALEIYYLEHNAYPAWSLQTNQNANGFAGNVPELAGLPTFRLRNQTQLATLTTPVAYLTSYFSDPFSPVKGASFCYWTPDATTSDSIGYLVWSPGPDHVYDITMDNVVKAYDPATSVPSALLVSLTYDPSNGTQGGGDVYRYKQ